MCYTHSEAAGEGSHERRSCVLVVGGAHEVTFIVTLKDKDGMAVPHAAINVALIGGGSLQPDGGRPGLPFVFQETDESGTIRFSWLSGLDQPSEVILNVSAARGDSLSIRQL